MVYVYVDKSNDYYVAIAFWENQNIQFNYSRLLWMNWNKSNTPAFGAAVSMNKRVK